MNGFEGDLRQKILGSNAHIQITKEDGEFTEWAELRATIGSGPWGRGLDAVRHLRGRDRRQRQLRERRHQGHRPGQRGQRHVACAPSWRIPRPSSASTR
jgi:ABC-type lipoprotein release transport system permease subunit